MNINPFIGAVLQSPQVEKQQADAKSAQVRRAQELRRNIAAESDRFTHTVESPEELRPVHEEREEARRYKKRRRSAQAEEDPPTDDDAPPHVDVTA